MCLTWTGSGPGIMRSRKRGEGMKGWRDEGRTAAGRGKEEV